MSKCTDCSTCVNRHIHFPDMDDNEISMQECLCDGEDYEEEVRKIEKIKGEDGPLKKEIKVRVTFTEGYQKRFTEACLEVLRRREKNESARCAG